MVGICIIYICTNKNYQFTMYLYVYVHVQLSEATLYAAGLELMEACIKRLNLLAAFEEQVKNILCKCAAVMIQLIVTMFPGLLCSILHVHIMNVLCNMCTYII